MSDGAEKLVLILPEGTRQEYTFSKANVTIGRGTVNDIVVRDVKVSRTHARVERGPGGVEVVDLGSANGLRVNGAAATRARLRPGDEVTLGSTVIRFEAGGEEPATEMTRNGAFEEFRQTLIEVPLTVNLVETEVPRLAVHTEAGTWEVAMPGERLTIGRLADNDVVIDEAAVSRHHAVVERRGDTFLLRDLGSGNGTWLRGRRVDRATIDDGASFQVGSARLLFKGGVTMEGLSTVEQALPSGRPRVVVIPGFGGSNLWRGSEKVWPAPTKLFTEPDLLNMSRPLEARGLVDDVVIIPGLLRQEQYSSLTDYLTEELEYESGNDLMEFAYDFRQDNRESARQLAAAIERWEGTGPVTLIAHSMGCLIARYYVEVLGGSHRVGRVIYIGAPHSGTPYGFASLLHGPGLLPLGILNARLRETLASYPSWYQILPTYSFASNRGSAFDVLTEESWVTEEHRGLLRSAREFRRELGSGSCVPSVCVFGYGFKTINGVSVERDRSGLCSAAEMAFDLHGDGMIPEASAVLPSSEIHPVHQRHGALYGNTDVKMRLKLELTRSDSK